MKTRELEVTTNGAISLAIHNGNRPWWWYLEIEGQPLYLIGNDCDTCPAIFRRVDQARLPLTPQQLSAQLEAGLNSISQEVMDTVAALLPKGRYAVQLLTVKPTLLTQEKTPGRVSCEADYFWSCPVQKHEEHNDEIILPIVPSADLNAERIASYKARLERGEKPTALAFSILDKRTPGGRYVENILAHFLLDGHHKVMAASQLSQPVSILSFMYLTNNQRIKRY